MRSDQDWKICTLHSPAPGDAPPFPAFDRDETGNCMIVLGNQSKFELRLLPSQLLGRVVGLMQRALTRASPPKISGWKMTALAGWLRAVYRAHVSSELLRPARIAVKSHCCSLVSRVQFQASTLSSQSFRRPLYHPVAFGVGLHPAVGEIVGTTSAAGGTHAAMESAALPGTSCYAVPTKHLAKVA